MLRPPPALQAVYADAPPSPSTPPASSVQWTAPGARRQGPPPLPRQVTQDVMSGSLSAARTRPSAALAAVNTPTATTRVADGSTLAAYLSLKAAYNLDEEDEEDDGEEAAQAVTPPRTRRSDVHAQSPTRTPLRELVVPTPSPHRSIASVRETASGNARLADAARAEALAHTLELGLAPHLPAATQAILEALVAVEEGDDVPQLLSAAIADQLALLTRRLSTLAVAELAPAAAPVTSAGPLDVSGEDVRGLRDELQALRTALVASHATASAAPAVRAPPTRHAVAAVPLAMSPPRPVSAMTMTSTSATRQSSPSVPRSVTGRPVVSGDDEGRVSHSARFSPTAAPTTQSVKASQTRTREEEEIWRVAQRLIDESRAYDA